MQVTIETTSNLGRKLYVKVPNEDIQAKLKDKLKELSKQVKLDGFRPGKVPVDVVQQRFGKAARSEIIGEVLQHTLYEAIMKENLKPAGLPEIESIKDEEGNPLEYTAIFDVYPAIELIDFSTLNAEKISAEVTESDVDEMLESIRKQRTEWKKTSHSSKLDDKLLVDFEGFKDDQPFEGGKANDANIILGSKTFIAGFEEGLINKKEGEEVELNLTFPADYHVKDLAGAAVKFKVKIKEIYEPELPKLDEEFIKSMGIESGDIAEFKAQILEHMQRELKQAIKIRQKENIFKQLLEKHTFDIPESLVRSEIRAMLKQYMPKQEPTKEQIENAPEPLKDEATRRVAIGLIISEIIQKYDIKVDHEKVKNFIEEIAKAYEHSEQMISWYYSNKERMAGIEAAVLEEQVYEKICEHAKLQDQNLTYSAVMKHEQN